MRPGYRKGSHLVVDDRTGFTHWSHEMVKEWNGAIVHRSKAEPRHPQDFLRARPDRMKVTEARPRPIDVFVGPLMTETTADAAAGDTSLTVLHTQRMQAGDSIGIFLDSGDLYRTTILAIASLTGLTIVDKLPGPAASGAILINYTAIATADIE